MNQAPRATRSRGNRSTRRANTPDNRLGLIQAVKTPLGFFVLVVLIVEAVLGGLASVSSSDRTLLIWGMLILLGSTIAIVAALAYLRPYVLQPLDLPFSVYISAPVDMSGLDIGSIHWDSAQCFLMGTSIQEPVQLVPSRVGPTLKVHIPPELGRRLSPTAPYRLELLDAHGIHWRVANFYFFESVHPLTYADSKENVLAVYEEEQ
jgi:hypothetical protein